MTSRRSLLVIDAGLLLSVFAVPFAFGGRHSIGEFILVCSAVICTAGWVLHQWTSDDSSWIRTRIEPLLLAILALGLIQIVPLPQSIVTLLSPAMDQVLPLRSPSANDGVFQTPWSTLSMCTHETSTGLAIGVAYVLLFIVTVQRIRAVDDAARLLRMVCVSGVAMTVFAFVQFLFSNGYYFWFIDLPQGVADDRLKGAFLNKNHFAQFVALSIGPLVWWLGVQTDRSSPQKSYGFNRTRKAVLPGVATTLLLSAGLGAVITAVLISRSRGAFVALSVAGVVLVLTLHAKSLISRKQFSVMATASLMAVLLVGIVGHREISRVSERLHNWDSNGRIQIWNANLDVFREFPLVGAGIGSHSYIHQRHLDLPYSTGRYSHAESGYLQIATETGLPGIALTVICLSVAFFWCIRGIRISQNRAVTFALCGVTCSLLISCLQSFVDFVWYIPGCMIPLVIQLACACRLYQMEADQRVPSQSNRLSRIPRFSTAFAAICLIPLAGWMLSEWTPRLLAEPYWSNYRKITLADRSGKDIRQNLKAKSDTENARLQQVMSDLRQAVKRNPNDSRLHTRLAVQYVRAFHTLQQNSENPLPLSQIRDAAQAGGFESLHEMQEWLVRVFGDNIKYAFAAGKHARRAIELNPLDGKAWLSYSELAFLDGVPQGYDRKCVDQSLRLLPNDALVLYSAGRDARAAGDIEAWVDYWKKAFHRDEGVQSQIVRQLAEWTDKPVEIIVKAFEPDIPALERAEAILGELGQKQNQLKAIEVLAARLIEQAQATDNQNRAADWRRAAFAFVRLGNADQTEACFQRSVQAAPTDFRIHFEFGSWLLEQGRPAAASEHIQWCARVAPNDSRTKTAIAELKRSTRRTRNIRQVNATPADLRP